MQLNKSFRNSIEIALNNTYFSKDDFEIQYPEYGDLVYISFKHHHGFTLNVEEVEYEEEIKTSSPSIAAFGLSGIGGDSDYKKVSKFKFVSIECPGAIKAKDRHDLGSLRHVLDRFQGWCENIERELIVLYALPENEDEQISQKIESIFPDEIDSPDEHFTSDERDALKASLNSLYERIQNVRAECDISESKLNNLKLALDKANKTAGNFPKGVWLKINKGKISSELKKIFSVPEVRTFALEVIKKIALSG